MFFICDQEKMSRKEPQRVQHKMQILGKPQKQTGQIAVHKNIQKDSRQGLEQSSLD